MEQVSTLVPEGYDPKAQVDTEGYLKEGIKKTATITAAAVAASRGVGLPAIIGGLAFKTAFDMNSYNKEEFKELGGSNADLSTMQELYKGQEENEKRITETLADFLKRSTYE